MFVTGLRGAMSFALVENIPLFSIITNTGSRYKPELKACTVAVIIFTTFLNGGVSFATLKKFNLNRRECEPGSDGLEMVVGREDATDKEEEKEFSHLFKSTRRFTPHKNCS